MKIIFKSIATLEKEKKIIEFQAPVKIINENNMKIFEFREPSKNIMNRIEISKKKVNIFAGPSTINLEINKMILNEYETIVGIIMFESFLKKIIFKKNDIKIFYYLSQNNKKFGNFEISIIII
jgi:hypothetical protein